MDAKGKLIAMWGCGLVLLVIVAVVGSGTWYAYRMTRDFGDVKDGEDALIAATGPAEDFVPAGTGLPTPGRMEDFLSVREGLAEWRSGLERAVSQFQAAQEREQSGVMRFLRTLRAGTDLAPVYAGFWEKRNALLFERSLGPGEYAYLYRLTSYVWLGRDPADGIMTPAGTALAGGSPGGAGPASGRSAVELSARARAEATARMRTDLERIVWPETAGDEAATAWKEAVTVWLAAGDQVMGFGAAGPPKVLDGILGPFRARLERAYSETLNPVEAMFTGDVPGEDD